MGRPGRFAWRARLVAFVALGALMVTGCGAGGVVAPPADAVPTASPTPVGIPTTPPRILTPTPGPSPTATVVAASGAGESYTSALFNYSITVPRGWNILPGGGRIGPSTADAFTGPTVEGFPTNVNILAETLPAGIAETPAYFRAQAAGLQAVGIQFSVVESVAVGSGRATLITYTNALPDSEDTYRVHQVVMVAANRGWIMTLSTSELATEAGLADFKALLASFQPR